MNGPLDDPPIIYPPPLPKWKDANISEDTAGGRAELEQGGEREVGMKGVHLLRTGHPVQSSAPTSTNSSWNVYFTMNS